MAKGIDSDRGYGAREGQRESGRDSVPDRGAKSSASPDGAARFSGADGGRTDRFGARGDQQHDDTAGWRAVGDANPDGRVGGEDEKPGDGDPLGAGVR